MHKQIVDECAAIRHQPRIMRLADGELRGVIAGNVLDQINRVRAADFNLAHVAHVKQPRCGARRHVFRDDSGILHGHVPSAEVDHLGPHPAMDRVKRGFAEFRFWKRHEIS